MSATVPFTLALIRLPESQVILETTERANADERTSELLKESDARTVAIILLDRLTLILKS